MGSSSNFFIAFLLFTPFAFGKQQLPSEQVIEIAKATATITIKSKINPSIELSGTAFFVNPNHLITSLHNFNKLIVKSEEYYFEIETFDGVLIDKPEVVFNSLNDDLSLIKVNYQSDNFINIFNNTKRVKTLSNIYGFGNMNGWGIVQFHGSFLTEAYRETDENRVLISSKKYYQGNSGGPVFDENGLFIGISTSIVLNKNEELTCDISGSLGLLTPALAVKKFIFQYEMRKNRPTNLKTISKVRQFSNKKASTQ